MNLHSFLSTHPFSNGSMRPLLSFDNEYMLGSNVFNRHMLLNGPNDEANQENLERIENESTKRIGNDGNYQIRYQFNHKRLEGNNFSYTTVVAGHRQLLGSLLSPDLTTLLLFGNASFLGTERELAYSNLQQFRYNHVGVRQAWVSTKNANRRTFEVGGKFLHGAHYLSSGIERGSLFTDSLGESMTGEFKADYIKIGENEAFNTAGWGAALDLKFQTTLSNTGAVSLELTDFGFIRYQEAELLSIDSTIDYQGIVVDPNSKDPLNFNLQDEFLSTEDTRLLVIVPYTLKVKLHYRFTDRDWIEVAVENRNIGAFVQRFRASYSRFMGANGAYILTSGLDVGGFGQYNWRETFTAQVNDRFAFQVGLGGIEGILFNSLPMNAYANLGLNISLK